MRGAPERDPVVVSTTVGTIPALMVVRPPVSLCTRRSSRGTTDGAMRANVGLAAMRITLRPTTPSWDTFTGGERT